MSQSTTAQQPPLDNPETPDREWVAKGLDRWGKLQIADHARLMADNQRTLDMTNAADRAHRALGQRIAEWDFQRFKAKSPGNPSPGSDGASEATQQRNGIQYPADEEMKINIDSPTTINYVMPDSTNGKPPAIPAAPAPQPAAAPGGISKLAMAGLLAAATAGGAVPAGVAAYLMRPAAQAAVDAGKDFGLDLLPPEKPTSKTEP